MLVKPRLVVASLLFYVTACGLVYDVGSVSTHYKDCGTQGKRCCAGNVCEAHLACVAESQSGADAAAPDGGDAAPPANTGCDCPDAAADASGLDGAPDASVADAGCTCANLVCKHCGDPGEPCCGTGDAAYGACNSSDLKCNQGRCTGCGEKGQACCSGNVSCATDKGLSCSSGNTCIAKCGGDGQECCNGTCDPGLSCNNSVDKCQPSACGADGGPCCDSGARCATGDLACVAGACTPCGLKVNEHCCDTLPQCAVGMNCDTTSDLCTPCGTENLPCCAGNSCTDSTLHCGADGSCHTCPYAGFTCGTSKVCVGVGDSTDCVGCGLLGEPCCAKDGQGGACPNLPTCCNGSGQGCVLCNTSSCTCKVCCVRCGSGPYQQIVANGGDCATSAGTFCSGKGGKTFGRWSPSCPP